MRYISREYLYKYQIYIYIYLYILHIQYSAVHLWRPESRLVCALIEAVGVKVSIQNPSSLCKALDQNTHAGFEAQHLYHWPSSM